jgi:Domain of unknown function (DUF3943)
VGIVPYCLVVWYRLTFEGTYAPRVSATAFCVFAALGWVRPAQASERTPVAETAPTFAYASGSDAEPKALRAVLELEAVFALGFVWYATTGSLVSQWDVGYDWKRFRDKITGQSFGPDTNHFGTNFIGHPLGGTGYYLAARGSRLSILPSLGYAFAGSLLWELFGEIRERVSMNDTIVTPLAGIALGEPFTQFAAYLDRQPATAGRRFFGALLGPSKTLNDAFDGLTLDRQTVWNESQHGRLELMTSLAQIPTSVKGARESAAGGIGIAASERLIRLPDYESAGQRAFSFSDANVSSIGFRVTMGALGVSDAEFQTDAMMLGRYWRDARYDARGALRGTSLLVGLVMGFRYAVHDYSPETAGPLDRFAAVRPLGFALEQRLELGSVYVRSDVNLGVEFGGITPLTLKLNEVERERQPAVMASHGYYFGSGGHVESSLEVGTPDVSLTIGLKTVLLTDIGGPGDPARLSVFDSLTELRSRLSLRIAPRSTLELGVERRSRSSHLGSARAQTSELALGVGTSLLF